MITGNNSKSSVIQKDQWWDILSRLIDVIHINIFIIDADGRVLLPPDMSRYGGRLMTDPSLGFGLNIGEPEFLENFHRQGRFWESQNRYDLRMFMIPLVYRQEIAANVIVGPVILTLRLDREEYKKSAKTYHSDANVTLDFLNEIRVVSNVMMNSILELLDEIIKTNMQLLEKRRSMDKNQIDHMAKEINTSLRQDEILVTLLDIALKMTGTECGSIMIFDSKSKNELVLKASKGLDEKHIKNIRVRLGEGLTGLAAQQDEYFVINGSSENPHNNRIAHLLKRPDIQEALVMPLKSQNKVFGVLSLHTKVGQSRIQENLMNIQYLSDLVSSSF